MKEKFGHKNDLAVPRLERVVLNVGLGHSLKDSKFINIVENTLLKITGQKPIKTLAKKSVSSFKIREGMVVGMKVTLRGERMWAFLDKLINVAFPRIRDFRGFSLESFDQSGNYSVGIREHVIFPEVNPNITKGIRSLQVTIVFDSDDIKKNMFLLKELSFPFAEAGILKETFERVKKVKKVKKRDK